MFIKPSEMCACGCRNQKKCCRTALLDRGIAWTRIAALVREAYEKIAPEELRAALGKTPTFTTPTKPLSASDVDPFKSSKATAVLKKLRTLCLALPETSETRQLGCPAWQAGKKTFALARFNAQHLNLLFWVGAANQSLLIADPRYSIPPYLGHNGWIAVAVGASGDWEEIAGLLDNSYRHFALKRMLLKLSIG